MLKFLIRIGLLLFVLHAHLSVLAQHEKDTIRLEFKELLLLNDTIYYGHLDSVVVLNKNQEYQILENSFVKQKGSSEKEEIKTDTTELSVNKLKKFVEEQIYNTKEIVPKGFIPSDDYFKNYNGKIIKNILYNQVDVLDGNVYDTTKISTGFGRFLNNTHAPTKKKVLEYNTRFKRNETVNSRIFSDNERILRNLPYVEEAKIYVLPLANNSDSVNVVVVTKDKYPIGIRLDVNDYNHFQIEPYTRNFMGLGHRIGANFIYEGDADQKFGYGFNYLDDNVLGTFANGEMAYLNSDRAEYFYARIEKPFVATDTKFGGEVGYEVLSTSRMSFHHLPDSILENDDNFTVQNFDIWAGYSIFTSRDITKPFFNVAARFYNEVYTKRPEIDPGNNFSFHDKYTYLGALSYQQVSFLETSKLLNFGIIEYVPTGFNFGVTTGWQKTTYINRPYAGFHINYSILLKKTGIFSLLTEVGGYYRKSKVEDGVVGAKLNYFSPLLPVSRFELRHIFTFSLNTIVNPLYLNKITFDRDAHGLHELEQYGNSTLLLKYQPIFYTPYELLGFNLSVNPYIDMAWVSESDIFDRHKQFYSILGLGASLKNESLIFPAMHVYAGYHPNSMADNSKFSFEIVFKDYKILDFFAELKPKPAHPEDFYW